MRYNNKENQLVYPWELSNTRKHAEPSCGLRILPRFDQFGSQNSCLPLILLAAFSSFSKFLYFIRQIAGFLQARTFFILAYFLVDLPS
ncbi:hypothetical protein Ahy_B03g065198 isoform F [Arachis hypogaea]|uniref:Uncharacterized protein n=1 Tax=Arachis hypogaea TaxID=3818 RepID=A0A445A108_ARAHY|nr:hypothetical protein Ahy_B03g065198 isoform F [Arachis hypogaea]